MIWDELITDISDSEDQELMKIGPSTASWNLSDARVGPIRGQRWLQFDYADKCCWQQNWIFFYRITSGTPLMCSINTLHQLQNSRSLCDYTLSGSFDSVPFTRRWTPQSLLWWYETTQCGKTTTAEVVCVLMAPIDQSESRNTEGVTFSGWLVDKIQLISSVCYAYSNRIHTVI